MLLSPIHCCDVTKPPFLLSGELCTSPLHSSRLYVYTVCYQRGGQCFSVLRTHHTDVVGDSSGRSYVTEQGHNVPLLRTRGLSYQKMFSYLLRYDFQICIVSSSCVVRLRVLKGRCFIVYCKLKCHAAQADSFRARNEVQGRPSTFWV